MVQDFSRRRPRNHVARLNGSQCGTAMNILFVCHRFPYPPIRGGKIRPFHMIRHLSQRHRVVVATLAHSQEELHEGRDLAHHCSEVIAEVIPSPVRWLHAALALPTGAPSSARYFWSA